MSKEIGGNSKGSKMRKRQPITTTILKKLLLLQRDGEVLIIVSYEDAYLYNSTHDSDLILDFESSYHATPRK
jgi:hypothetical protein